MFNSDNSFNLPGPQMQTLQCTLDDAAKITPEQVQLT